MLLAEEPRAFILIATYLATYLTKWCRLNLLLQSDLNKHLLAQVPNKTFNGGHQLHGHHGETREYYLGLIFQRNARVKKSRLVAASKHMHVRGT